VSTKRTYLRWWWVVAAALAFLFSILIRDARQRAHSRLIEQTQRYQNEWAQKQLAQLRSGDSDSVHFYDTHGTDEILKSFQGMSQIRKLGFELTDISADGLEILAKLSNLQELLLYGGRPNVDDDDLQFLAGHANLNTLQLVNTEVTDHGLRVLATLPSLRAVELHRDSFRHKTLTDAGLHSLRVLQKLEHLDISGGWASEAAVEELRAALPNCQITTESKW
jgi:hypothetical protein